MNDDLDRDWIEPTEEQKGAAKVPPEKIADATDLPEDVRDGDIGAGEEGNP